MTQSSRFLNAQQNIHRWIIHECDHTCVMSSAAILGNLRGIKLVDNALQLWLHPLDSKMQNLWRGTNGATRWILLGYLGMSASVCVCVFFFKYFISKAKIWETTKLWPTLVIENDVKNFNRASKEISDVGATPVNIAKLDILSGRVERGAGRGEEGGSVDRTLTIAATLKINIIHSCQSHCALHIEAYLIFL